MQKMIDTVTRELNKKKKQSAKKTPYQKKKKEEDADVNTPIKTLQKLKMMSADSPLGVTIPHYSNLLVPHRESDFQLIANINGRLEAVIEHLGKGDLSESTIEYDSHINDDIFTIPTDNSNVVNSTKTFEIGWKEPHTLESLITLSQIVDDSYSEEQGAFSHALSFVYKSVIDFKTNVSQADKPGTVPFIHVMKRETIVIRPGKVEFTPNMEYFAILADLPEPVNAQCDPTKNGTKGSENQSIDMKDVHQSQTFIDNKSIVAIREWNQFCLYSPMTFERYYALMKDGDNETHLGKVQLEGADKKHNEVQESHDLFRRRSNMAYDQIDDDEVDMHKVQVVSSIDIEMQHTVKINRNSIKEIKMRVVPGKDMEKPTVEQTVQVPGRKDSKGNWHVLPGDDYLEVKSSECNVQDEQHTYSATEAMSSDESVREGNPSEPKGFLFDYCSGNQMIFCPDSKLYIVDKFDVCSMLKAHDDPSEAIPYTDPKTRYGYIKFIEPPMYKMAVMYRVGWMSYDKYRSCFGKPYGDSGIKIRTTAMYSLHYDRAIHHEPKEDYTNKTILDQTHLKHVDPSESKNNIHSIVVHPDVAHDYARRPVKSYRNPLFKACRDMELGESVHMDTIVDVDINGQWT